MLNNNFIVVPILFISACILLYVFTGHRNSDGGVDTDDADVDTDGIDVKELTIHEDISIQNSEEDIDVTADETDDQEDELNNDISSFYSSADLTNYQGEASVA